MAYLVNSKDRPNALFIMKYTFFYTILLTVFDFNNKFKRLNMLDMKKSFYIYILIIAFKIQFILFKLVTLHIYKKYF